MFMWSFGPQSGDTSSMTRKVPRPVVFRPEASTRTTCLNNASRIMHCSPRSFNPAHELPWHQVHIPQQDTLSAVGIFFLTAAVLPTLKGQAKRLEIELFLHRGACKDPNVIPATMMKLGLPWILPRGIQTCL